MQLRPYQQACVEAIYNHLRTRDDHPCAVIPTAGGKTPIMATICRDAVQLWNGRVLILAHVKELLEQAADKLRIFCRGTAIGIYSAGLKRKDANRAITVGGIQSIYQRACDLDPFDLVLVDEAHLIPPDGEGMYRQFLTEAKAVNPNLRVIGFTATPFRMKSGNICSPGGILNHICYEVGVRELIVDGFLSPLVSKASETKFDNANLSVRGGEFVSEQIEAAYDQEQLKKLACAEIVKLTADRKSVLVFAAGVEHCRHVQQELRSLGFLAGMVTGESADADRFGLCQQFRDVRLKYLVNVNVLTTGFDAPNIDAVCLLRPTASPGLYYQMVGRGFRLSPETGKTNCLVLDFGGNVLRHGPVDRVQGSGVRGQGSGNGEAAAKECPQCHELIAAGYGVCPQCGYEFPIEDKPKHDPTASTAGVLSGQVTTEVREVQRIAYSIHKKRGAEEDAPRTLRVDYECDLTTTFSEWVCFEHEGFAKAKAIAWWKARSQSPVPDTIEQAATLCREGAVAEPTEITVRFVSGEKFPRIVDYKLEPVPASVESVSDDIPF